MYTTLASSTTAKERMNHAGAAEERVKREIRHREQGPQPRAAGLSAREGDLFMK